MFSPLVPPRRPLYPRPVHAPRATNITHQPGVTREQRRLALGHTGLTVWCTGLPASGKSSIATALEHALLARRIPAYRLDGDALRLGLNRDLGFTEAGRAENIRRIAEVAAIVADAGLIAIVSAISPSAASRAAARATHDAASIPFLEVFVDTPLAECERRDPKGLYRRARAGDIPAFTGVSAPYEPPMSPDLRITPDLGDAAACAAAILALLEQRRLLSP